MKIIILLSTYNGEKYLDEQLKSIYTQTVYDDLECIVRDDGSTDNTLNILNNWKDKLKITIYAERNIGVAKSFLTLLQYAPTADYYAFCDQDDVWDSDKLEIGISMIKDLKQPSLYTCNLKYVDEDLQSLGCNRHTDRLKELTLSRAFTCCCAEGCTMIFNKELHKYLKIHKIETSAMHDMTVLLCALMLGEVVYDPITHIQYRQHCNNVSQRNSLKSKFLQRYRLWFKSSTVSVDKQAQELLKKYGDNIRDNSKKKVLEEIANYKRGINRFKILISNQYKSEYKKETRSFKIRILLGLA